MLIPAYWYPGDDGPFNPAVNWWQLPCNRVQGNGAIVVMNQSNGKFTEQDPNYRAGKALCQAAGADVIGYVTTGGGPAHRGGRRLLSSVKANVDAYYNLYRGRPGRPGMDGIFFDQMQNNPNNVGKRAAQPGERRNKRYYRLLYKYVKSKTGQRIVVGNPGAQAATGWQLKQGSPVVDILVTFEGPLQRVEHAVGVNGDPEEVKGYNTFTRKLWTKNHDPRSFAHLVYRTRRTASRRSARGHRREAPDMSSSRRTTSSCLTPNGTSSSSAKRRRSPTTRRTRGTRPDQTRGSCFARACNRGNSRSRPYGRRPAYPVGSAGVAGSRECRCLGEQARRAGRTRQ
jgi:hypothetical protein